MALVGIHVFIFVLSAYCLSTSSASSCEETETAQVKLDLAKQSISNAKLLYPKCGDEKNDSSKCSIKDKSLGHLNAALDLISEAKITCHACPEPKIIVPTDQPIDCSDIQSKGHNKSGVYQVWPKGVGIDFNKSIDVYCDMETDGGGWTVIQRRGNFSVRTDFSQGWEAYKKGFGDIRQEFWLGNDKMSALTNQGVYSGRFDLVDVRREYKYAQYSSFSIGDENSGYVLHFDKFTGNATNDMEKQNGTMFSTKDRQNDGNESDKSCITLYFRSPFWFNNKCGMVNLNGIYQPGVKGIRGITWFMPKMDYECLYSVEIKIRRGIS